MKIHIALAGIIVASAVIFLAFYVPIASIIVACIGLIGAAVYWISTKNKNT